LGTRLGTPSLGRSPRRVPSPGAGGHMPTAPKKNGEDLVFSTLPRKPRPCFILPIHPFHGPQGKACSVPLPVSLNICPRCEFGCTSAEVGPSSFFLGHTNHLCPLTQFPVPIVRVKPFFWRDKVSSFQERGRIRGSQSLRCVYSTSLKVWYE